MLRQRRHPEEELIGAVGCSFLAKSGEKTWGLGPFFSSSAGKNKKRLEVSILGVIGTKSGEPIGGDATQTPSISAEEGDGYTRVDFCCEQLLDLAPRLGKADFDISHWVGDGYYAKQKIFEGVVAIGAVRSNGRKIFFNAFMLGRYIHSVCSFALPNYFIAKKRN